MTVLITLTLAGADSGPYDLYSDLDGYVTPFATGVSKSALLAGYTTAAVPDGTITIRVTSTGTCTNYIDFTISGNTTTTTTSTSSTTSTTTTTTPCISGVLSATAGCSSGQSSLFTISAGNQAVVTPSGYYYSGSGTRTYVAYVANAADTVILYNFYYSQTDATPGSWYSDLPGNTLPAGTYNLHLNVVDCAGNGSGSFNLTVGDCGPA